MVRSEQGGRRAWLARWLLGVLGGTLVAPRRAQAARVNAVQRFATLCGEALGRRPQGVCQVPDGATVELVAEVSGLGLPPLHPRHWVVRVHGGPCDGAEFSVRQGRLLDERDKPEPNEAPGGSAR
jgi:hypothetical protein